VDHAPNPEGNIEADSCRTERRNLIRALHLILEGKLRRASDILLRDDAAPPVHVTADVIKSNIMPLYKLDPAVALSAVDLQSLPTAPSFTDVQLYAVLKGKFSKTAAGMGGLSVAWLQSLWRLSRSDKSSAAVKAFPQNLTDLVNRLASGKIDSLGSEELTSLFNDGRGLALHKRGGAPGAIRPIGILNIVTVLTHTLLLRHDDTRAAVRAADPTGNDTAMLADGTGKFFALARAAIENGSAHIATDFFNAFGSLDRNRMLKACAKYAPHLLRRVTACYGRVTGVHFDGDNLPVVHTNVGVLQGCPFAMLLFSLTISDALNRNFIRAATRTQIRRHLRHRTRPRASPPHERAGRGRRGCRRPRAPLRT
jgi:hypothetical protein